MLIATGLWRILDTTSPSGQIKSVRLEFLTSHQAFLRMVDEYL